MIPMEPSVELEDKPCPLGCSPSDEPVLTGGDQLHGLPGLFTVVKCRTCGLMRTNPRPTPGSIGLYYPADYGPYRDTRVGPEQNLRGAKRILKKVVRALLRRNDDRIPRLRPGRLLEVGCAAGRFMHGMAQDGWQVEGIEFSDDAARNARRLGYPVHSGPLETAPEPTASYDLVVGWMVVEHLHDPVDALAKLNRWTRPGGWLVLSMPNAGSYEFRIFRDMWYALQLPTHLTHFTPATIERILSLAGWRPEKILHQQNLDNLIASFGYRLRAEGKSRRLSDALIRFPETPSWLHYALFPIATVASWFGQTGRMTVWARKPEA